MEDYSLFGTDSLLLDALQSLDQRLESLLKTSDVSTAVSTSYRGLYINREMAETLLKRPSVTVPPFDHRPMTESIPRFQWLGNIFGLTPFELDVILIALAPEVDLRYGQLYGYLQDDITQKRPRIDLILRLLCGSTAEKMGRLARFLPDATLVRERLLRLSAKDDQTPLLAHTLQLDEQIVRLLLDQPGPDSRLVRCSSQVDLTYDLSLLPLDHKTKATLQKLTEMDGHLYVYFEGPHQRMKQPAAEALAFEMGKPLLVAEASEVSDTETLRLLFREAWLEGAILYLNGLEGTALPLERLDPLHPMTIMSGVERWRAREQIDVISIPFPLPAFEQRRACWALELGVEALEIEDLDLDMLADRFSLTIDQIANAVSSVRMNAELRSKTPTQDDLVAAARQHSAHDLAQLARKIEALYTWKDLVLADDSKKQLDELCQRLTHRPKVFGAWGFQDKLSRGKGVNALFMGAAGTGKTMTAEVIANDLKLDLYQIDLARVVSKYIGETEKHLNAIFSEAQQSNAILFFDEADALFGKRSEVHDSHDRYANIEISYLLQKMEEYEGMAILTTNLRQNLDEAFMRRFAFTILFPMPDEKHRRDIWEQIWPQKELLDENADLDYLAQAFPLSGGNIKNIALAAAFLAAESGGLITMAHLFQATRREYQKMGKVLDEGQVQAEYRAARAGVEG